MVAMSNTTEIPVGPASAPESSIAVRKAWYRRPGLILALVLAVLAAAGAVLFVVLSSNGITARGTVIDRLTGQPLAAASVHGGGKSATTNARGKFQIADIAAGTTLHVQARYYAPAQVKAAPAPVTVRLALVPVPVAVTSAMTGRPLPATLVMPNGDRVHARADGTTTLYRIGPGEAVTVQAAGYLPGHAVLGADHTVKAALAPTVPTMTAQLWRWERAHRYQAIIDWMLRPATGYTFTETSPYENRQTPGDPMTAYTGSSSTADGTGATIQISRPGVRWDTTEIARLMVGPPMHPVTLAGQRAWRSGPGDYHVFVTTWSYGPALVNVTSATAHQADAVMTGIIKAMISTQQGN
jgi:hypothetical protein